MYERFEKKWRMLPVGVTYINSWLNEPVTLCYQLMETESPEALKQWMEQWNDLVEFEVVPVISSAEAKAKTYS